MNRGVKEDLPMKFKAQEPHKLEPGTHVRVEVYYDEGGTNFLSGQNNSRGYYASARSVTLKDGCVSFVMFKGIKTFIEGAGRYNAKKLATIAAAFRSDPRRLKLIESVLREEGRELETPLAQIAETPAQAPAVG